MALAEASKTNNSGTKIDLDFTKKPKRDWPGPTVIKLRKISSPTSRGLSLSLGHKSVILRESRVSISLLDLPVKLEEDRI